MNPGIAEFRSSKLPAGDRRSESSCVSRCTVRNESRSFLGGTRTAERDKTGWKGNEVSCRRGQGKPEQGRGCSTRLLRSAAGPSFAALVLKL